jgi:hypothetical protein
VLSDGDLIITEAHSRYSEGGRQLAVSEPVGMSHNHSRLKSCLFWSYVNRVSFRLGGNAHVRVADQAECLLNATTTRITHSGNPRFLSCKKQALCYIVGVSAYVFSPPLSFRIPFLSSPCGTGCRLIPGVCSTVRERQRNTTISRWRYCLSRRRV